MEPVIHNSWLDLLKRSVDSHSAPAGESASHTYIVYDENRGEYGTVDAKGLGSGLKKLTINQITQESKRVIKELQNQMKQSGPNAEIHKYENLSADIESYTKSLIDARQVKYDQSNLLRRIGLVISAVASVFCIGIPFFNLIKRNDNKFKNEIRELRSEIENEIREFRSRMENVKKQNIDTLLEETLKENYNEIAEKYRKEIRFLKRKVPESFSIFLGHCKRSHEDFQQKLKDQNNHETVHDELVSEMEVLVVAYTKDSRDYLKFPCIGHLLTKCLDPKGAGGNGQVHTDSIFNDIKGSDVLDDIKEAIKGGTETRAAANSMSTSEVYDIPSGVITNLGEAVDQEMVRKAQAQLENDTEFKMRDNSHLLQKSEWRSLEKSNNNGFGRAYRVISFKNPGGPICEAKIELDLLEFDFDKRKTQAALSALKAIAEKKDIKIWVEGFFLNENEAFKLLEDHIKKHLWDACGERQLMLLRKLVNFEISIEREMYKAISNVSEGVDSSPLVKFLYELRQHINAKRVTFADDYLAKAHDDEKVELINKLPVRVKESFEKVCAGKTAVEKTAFMEQVLREIRAAEEAEEKKLRG